jgi:hypothetical protein
MILYFTNRPDSGNAVFLPKDELIKWINYLNPVICYNEEVESAFTRKVIYILYALIIGGIIVRIRNRKSVNEINGKSGMLRLNDIWLLITGIMLLLLFIMPDENGMASIISMRFGLLFFLFLIIWISSMKQIKWFVLVCSALLLIVHFKRVHYLDSIIEIHNKIAINCNKAERFIKPNSVIAPVNLTNNWFVAHFPNYLGIDKPMVILENYEAAMNYFPLLWKTKSLPNLEIGGESIAEYSLFSSNPTNLKNGKKEVDYIFVLGKWDSLNADHNNTLRMISTSFVQAYKNENCTLYRHKKLQD